MNTGYQRTDYASPFPDFVLQIELSRGWKLPKFTKFTEDVKQSNVKHVARYQTELGDLVVNEDLKMKYFPNSLTKNVFTWFTTLFPTSLQMWSRLEKLFHEQFYIGQFKISLTELSNVKRKSTKSID